ncbi:adenylate/guanylate cyclase domain-containing protein [Phyllobacterium zundukense]|uniref:Guanylate cyclase n=1 Tax=Phyllobacterium zundukense TaxID=1867719 RepID=A0A2N9VV26_9HYPH|nr:adenylate/guanylate cyclase domain-containing protein [Phyllobacterium zundukense]ATU94649.1 guanylate cyclase [Phyllobacterium zundukense]PIO43344.1 guanylate cyclase [Phyllobacterium zundukense]
MERHLAAVMIADVVGYGRLSQIDEEGTRARFQTDLKDVFEPRIAAHHGRLVKTMGDGILMEFYSVVDALRCAVEIQHQKAERNALAPLERRVDFRIGINLGDVIIEEDDIHGDGVNIADRLQALAEPGGIAISGTAYDHVKGKLPIGFTSLGEQMVKSIAEPIRVYRVVLDPAVAGKTVGPKPRRSSWQIAAAVAGVVIIVLGIAAAWRPWEPSPTAPAHAVADARPSLVVLPFDNLSDDKEQEYLANGFTEDLTTELARVPGLFVVSRNAAFAYKDKETKPTEIAAALGVRFLLEGSIRRVGDEMRINAQLIDAATAGHLWAERFDGQWADVFELQDKVATSIAGALKLRLISGQGKSNFAGGTSNPAAYDAYLRGMDLYNRKNTPEEFAQAVKYFQQALQLDPDFGAAVASLAWAYWDANDQRAAAMGISAYDAYDKVFEFLEVAAKHPSPAYYQLVAGLLVREHRSDEAVAVLLKSVAFDPSDPWNYSELSNALNFNGKPKEARDYLDAAMRVDPGWTDWRLYQAGLADFGQDRFEEAIGSLEKIDFQSPDPWPKFFGLQILLSAYGHLGRGEQVAAYKEKVMKVIADANDGEPSQLVTQKYLVFKNEADIERLLGGLSKAGFPELPADVDLDPKDRLTGTEIKSLAFGHELRGRNTVPDIEPYRRIASADGSITMTVGSRTTTGRTWVQGNFLCNAYPKNLTTCGAVFRNPSGTREQENEYLSIYRISRNEFSVVK